MVNIARYQMMMQSVGVVRWLPIGLIQLPPLLSLVHHVLLHFVQFVLMNWQANMPNYSVDHIAVVVDLVLV